jgi:hypothetical protein
MCHRQRRRRRRRRRFFRHRQRCHRPPAPHYSPKQSEPEVVVVVVVGGSGGSFIFSSISDILLSSKPSDKVKTSSIWRIKVSLNFDLICKKYCQTCPYSPYSTVRCGYFKPLRTIVFSTMVKRPISRVM